MYPGATALTRTPCPAKSIKKWSRRIPMQRLTKPEEVAEVILFLAGSKASAVTGVTYPVDRGILTAPPIWAD